MRKVDYRAQIGNFAYWRNVANEGRGSQMTKCLHEACDYAVKLETDRAALVEALMNVCNNPAGESLADAQALIARLGE